MLVDVNGAWGYELLGDMKCIMQLPIEQVELPAF